MRALVLFAALLLAACESGAEPGGAHATERLLTGDYRAASEASRGAGDLSIQRAGLIFENGVVLYTRTLEPRTAQDRIARDGLSYAALSSGRTDASIELRRITEAVAPQGASALCTSGAPSYAALLRDPRSQHLTLLIFSGDEPPGAQATQSALCATLAYTARGAVPQGVVLR